MATEKIISTRIVLTHDDYNETLKSKHLKEGEVVLAKVGEITEGNVTQPVFMMKVGTSETNKTVAELPWLMAPAADVYGWAKKQNLDAADVPTLEIAKISGLQDALNALAAEDERLAGLISDLDDKKADKVNGATAGNFAGLDADGNLTDSGKKAADFAEAGHSHTITATDDDVVIATGGELSVDVKHKKELGDGKSYTTSASTGVSEFGGSATLNIPSLTVNEYGHITAVEDKQITISIPTPEEVTLPTVEDNAVAGQLVTEVDQTNGAIAVTRKSVDVVYGDDGFIKLAIDGTPIGTGFDAAEFVKDSYLKEVNYDEASNILTFTFIDNEDNLQDIPVDLSDLVDVYDADGVSLTKEGTTFKIKDDGVTTVKIADKNVTKAKLEQSVQDSLDLANSAVQSVKVLGETLENGGELTVDEAKNALGLGTAAYKSEDAFVSSADGLALNNEINNVSLVANAANAKFGDWVNSDYAESNVAAELARIDGEIDGINGEIAAIDTGVMSVTANDTADKKSGIKVDNTDAKNPKIEIDDTIVFVLNGGDASNLD